MLSLIIIIQFGKKILGLKLMESKERQDIYRFVAAQNRCF